VRRKVFHRLVKCLFSKIEPLLGEIRKALATQFAANLEKL